MIIIINKHTTTRTDSNREIDPPFIKIELPIFIQQIKNEASWIKGDRNAITLFKNKLIRIVLIALRKKAIIKSHKANGAISIQILQGNMVFVTAYQKIELKRGEIITLQEDLEHSVEAKADTIFLLTIAKDSNKK